MNGWIHMLHPVKGTVIKNWFLRIGIYQRKRNHIVIMFGHGFQSLGGSSIPGHADPGAATAFYKWISRYQ